MTKKNVEGRHVCYDKQSDYLMMIIFVLGTMCIMRSMYVVIPPMQSDETSYQSSLDSPLTPPSL